MANLHEKPSFGRIWTSTFPRHLFNKSKYPLPAESTFESMTFRTSPSRGGWFSRFPVGDLCPLEGRIVVDRSSLFVLADLEGYGFRFFEIGQCLFELVCLH